MAPSGIFLIPASATLNPDTLPSSAIFTRLTSLHDLNPLQPWGLEHRLYKGTTASDSVPASETGQASYLQILSLSHQVALSHVGITTTASGTATEVDKSASPATIISIPHPSGSEELAQLMASRLGPLWALRQAFQIQSPHAYEVGELVIRFGEIRQGQGGQQQIRGTAVEIVWTGGEDDDWETAESVIKEFWEDLGIKGAKSFVKVAGVEEGLSLERQWFEALRLRT